MSVVSQLRTPAMFAFLRKITVEPVAFAFVLTIFCEYTALQEMLFTKICLRVANITEASECGRHSSLPKETVTEVVRLQAIVMKYYLGIMGFTGFLAACFTGSWSDMFGRKLPMGLPSLLGLGAEFAFVLVSAFLTRDDLVWLVYLGAMLNGLSGGVASVIAACFGYISDISDLQERTKRITILEGMFFVGGFCGFNLGGFLLKYSVGQDFHFVFVLCAAFHVLILLYIKFVVSETRGRHAIRHSADTDADLRSQTDERSIFSIDHVTDMLRTIFKHRDLPGVRARILLLLLCSIISSCATNVQTALTFTFVRKQLSWDSSQYSLYSGLNFLISGMSLITVVPIVVNYWKGFPDAAIAAVGFLSKGAGLALLGTATSTTVMFLCVAIFSFSEYTMPPIRSLISKTVGPDEKGKAFAFIGAVQNIVTFIGGIVFSSIFASSINWFPGLAFELVAALQLIAVLLLT